jgi:hypothetical protein
LQKSICPCGDRKMFATSLATFLAKAPQNVAIPLIERGQG